MNNPIKIETPNSHSQKQRLIMNALRFKGLNEMWVNCGTKFGKSVAAAAAMISAAPLKPDTLWRWVAPIHAQAGIGYDYCKRFLPGEPYVRSNYSKMNLVIPFSKTIETKIEFWHGQYPESLEGAAVHGYILDEASKMKEQVYNSAKTTTTLTRGPIVSISTPRGKNWFYKKCMDARLEMEKAAREGRLPTKFFVKARTIDNPFVDIASIKDAKETLPHRLFRQYYLAEFVDDGNVFLGFRECMTGELLDYLPKNIQTWLHKDAQKSEVILGVDWAKTTDYTVFIAMTYEGLVPKIVGFSRFQGVNYLNAVKELVKFSRQFKEVSCGYHDKTGIGTVIEDLLEQTDLPLEGMTFTNASKSSMVNNLIVGFEKSGIELPRWPELEKELDNYEVKVNDLGTMRYSAPSGFHDDIVSAIMLAYASAKELSINSDDVKLLEDLPKQETGLEGWYKDLIEESLEESYDMES